MKNRMDLIAEVRSKNTMTNLLICLKVLFDLVPQLLIVHMISSVFTGGTAPSRVAIDAGTPFPDNYSFVFLYLLGNSGKCRTTCLSDCRIQYAGILFGLRRQIGRASCRERV